MRDECWNEIERELRREEPVDEAAVARIVDRVRPRPALTRRARVREWLVRPRWVPVRPVWALGGAAAAALALFLVPGTGERTEGGTYPVQFVVVVPEASRVALAGDFNDWDTRATPLGRSAENGVWSVVVPLRSGRYRYAFVVDGKRWVADAAAPRGPEDEFGPSSVVLVGGGT